jgi:hypothetical protein
MRREQDSLPDFSRRSKPCDHISPTGKNRLKLDIQSRPFAKGCEMICYARFACVGMICRKKGSVHTRQGDELGQKFGGFCHVTTQVSLFVRIKSRRRKLAGVTETAAQ